MHFNFLYSTNQSELPETALNTSLASQRRDRLLADTFFTPRYDLAAAAADFRMWHANA